MLKIFISGNVPSSKNSQTWTGRFLVKSKTSQRYIKETKSQWLKHAKQFREQFDRLPKPVKITFKFIRGSKHKFDYINPCQTIQDLMTQHGWIPDDNADEIIPIFEQYEYDKQNPGVEVTITTVP